MPFACGYCARKEFKTEQSRIAHWRFCKEYRKAHPETINQQRATRRAASAVPAPAPPPAPAPVQAPPVEAPPPGVAGTPPPAQVAAPLPEAPPPVVASNAPVATTDTGTLHVTVSEPEKHEPLKPLPEFFGQPQAVEPPKPKEGMDKAELANLVSGLGELYNTQVERLATGVPRDPREIIKWSADDTNVLVNSVWPVIKKYGWDSDSIFGLLLKYAPEIGCVLGIGGLVIVKIQAALAIRKSEKEGGAAARPPPSSPGAPPIIEGDAEGIIDELYQNATKHIRT